MGLIAVYRLTHTKDEGLLEKEKDDWTRRNISRKIPRLKHREEKYRKENKKLVLVSADSGHIRFICIQGVAKIRIG